mgnify:CR=1 FL=1
MGKKNKVLVLIDGFNYYHKLKEYQDKYNKCVKWLNYRSLVGSWLYEDDDKESMEMYYFSAIATWRGMESALRHKTYIKALESQNINVVLGEFKQKKTHRCKDNEKCLNCTCSPERKKLIRHEEKNSDVNLAITLVEKSIKKEFIYETWLKTCLILGEAYVLQGNKSVKEVTALLSNAIERGQITENNFVMKCHLLFAFADNISGDYANSNRHLQEILDASREITLSSENILKWNFINIS